MENIQMYWEKFFDSRNNYEQWWERKQKLFEDREAEIIRIQGNGRLYRILRFDQQILYQYYLHLIFLIRQRETFYLEEQKIPYEYEFDQGVIKNHRRVLSQVSQERLPSLKIDQNETNHKRFSYDRRAAVRYAERWWNDYHPQFKTFTVDCTNYVSQCLYAGGAPMRGSPNRSEGWWYSDDQWSYSWAVAHSLRWYLSGSTKGLTAKEVSEAEQLHPGDVICYDFEGDDRWDHTTIVVAKDENNMPLVNAHTDNSRMRYWSYEDSAAWTPSIRYKFFQIE